MLSKNIIYIRMSMFTYRYALRGAELLLVHEVHRSPQLCVQHFHHHVSGGLWLLSELAPLLPENLLLRPQVHGPAHICSHPPAHSSAVAGRFSAPGSPQAAH